MLALIFEAFHIGKRPVSIKRQLPKTGFLGQNFTGHLVVYNPNSEPLDLRAVQELPVQTKGQRTIHEWSLNSGEQDSRPFEAIPIQLGEMNWRFVYTRRLGKFGLAWWSRKLSIVDTMTVVPNILRNTIDSSGNRPLGETSSRRSGYGGNLLHMRKYEPGDPLRMIDWKATARRQTPMVRVFTADQYLEVILMIDCGRLSSLSTTRLTRLNHFINCAARLAQQAIDNNDRVGLISFAEQPLAKLPPVNAYSGLLRVRHLLGNLRPLSQESNPLPAVASLPGLIKHRCLAVIFTNVEGDYLQSSLVRAVKLLRPKHLPLIATLEDEEIKTLATSPAKTWLDPHYTLAAQEFEHSRREAIGALKNQGAHVVSATPDKLDRAVLNRYESLRARRRI